MGSHLPESSSMNADFLITLEIVLVVDVPLLFLYLKGNWPLRKIIPCLLSIPVLWYLTYAPLHELSHIAGTYVVGGKVMYYKLIPRFWLGEFGHAWITTDEITQNWQKLVMLSSPYILDMTCIVAGLFVLRRNFSKNPFLVGLVLMLLCLRPAFDFVCETIAFTSGNKGDLYNIERIIGSFLTWSFVVVSLGLSLFSIIKILNRFVGHPAPLPVEPEN
jgi:hypothetical protein